MSEEQKKTSQEGASQQSFWSEAAELLKKNKKSFAVVAGAAVVLLGIGIVLGALIGRGSASTGNEAAAAETETASEEMEPAAQAVVQDVPLEENAYPEINALIEQYYQAAAAGDIDTINAIKDYSEQTELLQIQEKSKYLEDYEDINCYTKPGPQEDSYVVYASYYAKFRDIDQKVCGLNTFVVCKNENGEYYIHDCSQDEVMKEYRISVTKQDDVVELFNRIQVEYNETVTENAELAAFLTQLSDDLKVAVSDALASAETETTAEEENADAASEQETQVEEGAEASGTASMVEATDVVNIRRSDSETADVLGKAQVGDQFALLENKANGWSRIEYDGQEAYIKTEFLTEVSGASDAGGGEEVADASEPEESGGAAEDTASDEDTSAGEADSVSVPNSGTYRLTTTVNIRKSASETADRLGVGYSGDEVEILMKQADGWTKVRFNGEVGYIKTEVLR